MEEQDNQTNKEKEEKDNITGNQSLNQKNIGQKLSNIKGLEYRKRKVNEIDPKLRFHSQIERIKILDNYIYPLSNNSLNNSPSNIISFDILEGYNIIEMDEKDKKLMKCFNYLKENKGFEEEQIINIDNKITFKIKEINNDYFLVIIDNEIYDIEYFAREIIFVNKTSKIATKKFIYSVKNLLNSLQNLNFKYYYVNISKDKIDKDKNILELNKEKDSDSEFSTVSLADPFKIFYDPSINYIYNKNPKPVLRAHNFEVKFSGNLMQLKDLNNCSKYYYGKKKEDKFCMLSDYKNINSKFYHFRNSVISKIFYLYGPKGCSKTTFLLYMINKYGILSEKTLYFNFDYLEKSNIIDREKIIYHEILYFCKDIEEMKRIEEKKIFNGIEDKTNTMELIYMIIEVVLNIIIDTNNINRIIIIDNIFNNDKDTIRFLNNIIEIIKKKPPNFKIIICGRGSYFNQKLFEMYEKWHIFTNNDDFRMNQSPEFLYLFYIEQNKIHNCLNIDEKGNDYIDEEILKNESENLLYSFYGLYFSEELEEKTISYENIKKNKEFLVQMPLEFFGITKNKEGLYFKFYNNMFKKCLRYKIQYEVEYGTLTRLLKKNDYPRTFLGVCFEKLITLLLMHNKLNINNLHFNKGNIKEIKEITKLKEDPYSGPKFEVENKDEPILLIQENFFGPLYDLLIITKYNNQYYSDFIQISVDKTGQQIDDIINDLQDKYSLYKDNILKAFGIKSDFITCLFIFDLKIQKERNYSSGVQICLKKNINFYLFSTEDCSLIKLKDNNTSYILFDEYFPSSIIKENKNIINYISTSIKQNQKKEKIFMKESKEDDKSQKKMIDYINKK